MAHPERWACLQTRCIWTSVVVVVTNENVLHCCQAPSGAATHINSAFREIGAAFRASDYKRIVYKKDNLMHSFMPLAVWVFPSSQYLLSYLHLLRASDSERENISWRASSSLEPFGYNVYIADSIYAQFKQPDTRAQGTIEAVVCVQIQLGYEGWQGGNSTWQGETLVYLPLSPQPPCCICNAAAATHEAQKDGSGL